MILEAILATILIALVSVVGVFFFGGSARLVGIERYAIPVAVGVFLSLVFYELIPETLAASPAYGGIVIAVGFIGFYILASLLHSHYHKTEHENCDRKGAAMLLLIGDSVHNVADGVVLGGAFLIDPAVGIATAIGLALHELPQEIVEFGVLLRAGYTRTRAALYNLISASSILLGLAAVLVAAEFAESYIWIITGIAAGNLLFLAASDLLPRIHGNLSQYGSIWHAALSIIIGFVVMTSVLSWTHETFGHGHAHDEDHVESELDHTLEEHADLEFGGDHSEG